MSYQTQLNFYKTAIIYGEEILKEAPQMVLATAMCGLCWGVGGLGAEYLATSLLHNLQSWSCLSTSAGLPVACTQALARSEMSLCGRVLAGGCLGMWMPSSIVPPSWRRDRDKSDIATCFCMEAGCAFEIFVRPWMGPIPAAVLMGAAPAVVQIADSIDRIDLAARKRIEAAERTTFHVRHRASFIYDV